MSRGSSARSRGDEAVGSSVVAFLVAGVLFMGSIAAVLVTTKSSSSRENTADIPEAAAARIQADSLARILLASPGHSAGLTTEDWSDGASAVGKVPAADTLTRLGLLDAQSPVATMLDYAKFQNLRAAPLAASSTDGLVNYEEARQALGLTDAGVDFHIRAYPALQDVSDLLACQTAAVRPTCKDANLKVAYIGHIEPPSATTVPSDIRSQLGVPSSGQVITCTVSPAPKAYRVSSTVTNGGASNPATQFRGVFDVRFSDGPRYTKTVNSPLLAGGQTFTFTLDVPAYNGRVCGAGTDIDFDLYDANDRLLTLEEELAGGETAAGAAASAKDLWVEASTFYLRGTPGMKVTFDGAAAGNGFKSQPFTLVLYEGNGEGGAVRLVKAAASTSNAKGGDIVLDGSSALPSGLYTAVLYDGSFATAAAASSSSALRVSARVNVVDSEPGPYVPTTPPPAGSSSYVPDGVVATEVYFLDALLHNFCPTYYDEKDESPLSALAVAGTQPWPSEAGWTERCQTANPGLAADRAAMTPGQAGDVFPDAKRDLRDGLVERLICQVNSGCPGAARDGLGTAAKDEPRYDVTNVVVVGTNVDHDEMAPAEIKYALEDWVKGGGTLIVFGSDDQSVNWLMPILRTGIKSSSGGVSVPDPAHPVLHVPDELNYAEYDDHSQVWDFRGSHEATELFTPVIALGPTDEPEPVLAVSNPGAIQDPATGSSGTVVLTTFQAWDLMGCMPSACQGDSRIEEGLKFVNNLLMLGYGDLYLDYGPPIPANTNVIPAIRFAQIQHPDFAEPIQLKLNVFVFG